ncbi:MULTISPECIES: YjiH family protein [Halomonas]|uniref:YjiH family protein n=1 Tax=Halomonas TaxID=2745 RepID=UPI001A90B6BA|nr:MULTISPECIES: YjiH family protein [Halomonas]MED5294527.1 YjiH family protein [Pseudomonadota bacterium]MBN8411106.1 YjiH family protein [Halomonas litopenaei]MBY5970553.1 YjiH family protein [Halomonas denitrificans]MBY6030418.1 YjiH family protein [Halomonas sp. DP8Y7-1]MBY6208339.1 YjiH family protein [Halomonas sp. DP3Y7-2]
MATTPHSSASRQSPGLLLFKLLVPSAIGIFIFFIPVTWAGRSTIPLDHLVTAARAGLGDGARYYALALIVAGAAYPLIKGEWRRSATDIVFTVLKLLGVVAAVLTMTSAGPALLHQPDMLPFLYDKLVIPVGLIVPIGAIFLALLLSYGLLELIGILVQPVMRPLWRTPGRSAIDAVASFVGSYSIGLLITSRAYASGQYSAREAAIIATGFSTVSAPFMIIVAKTLGLMEVWNAFFWLTLVITFIVSAVTARLWPLSRMDNHASDGEPEAQKGDRLGLAWRTGIKVAEQAPRLSASVRKNLAEGLVMAISILPSIMSVGLLGLLVAKYTPVFEWLGWLFYPIVALFGIEHAQELAQASAAGLAEMFLPALLLGGDAGIDFVARFAAGVVSISSILFFSASIPCVVATRIPITLWQLVVVWAIRVALTLVLAIPMGMLLQ